MTAGQTITYRMVDGESLDADVYLPVAGPASGPHAPVVIAIHGGAWKGGARRAYREIGPFLADAGYVVMSIDYRLVRGERNRYPASVDDVRAAIAYVREHAAAWNADPGRIALMGDSAGGHLAALTALTQPGVTAFIGVFGIYDMAAQWQHDLVARATDNITQAYLGAPLTENPGRYFESSPLSYATTANNGISALLAWGTADDVVAPAQSERFLRALKQAGFYVRSVVQHAPHYWVGDPLDEPGSYAHFFAVRLLRFLNERLRP
jgi:acetyl esterase/lipase